MTPRIIRLESTTSTNTAMRQMLASEHLPHGSILTTYSQTAGRGQRGNSWEAEPGMNVTMSLLLRPSTPPNLQFRISEAVALGVAAVVENQLADNPHPAVAVKWPNDIYLGDRKIAGILIENSIEADSIAFSIAGIGLNVNQVKFVSDAPNPTSLRIAGAPRLDVDLIARQIADRVLHFLSLDPDQLHRRYLKSLWRRHGHHPFSTPDGKIFSAQIVDVDPMGFISLRDTAGTTRQFAFKEITFIL